jgi:hypothetical protein
VKTRERSRRHHSLSSLRLERRRLCSLSSFPRSSKRLVQQPSDSVIIAVVLWLLFFAANAFAVLRSPYPQKPDPPDRTIVITDSGGDSIVSTASKPK